MDKLTLENYISQGLSANKIAKLIGKSLTSVRYWMGKFSLKTKFKPFKLCSKEDFALIERADFDRKTSFANYDWPAIQLEHDNGATWNELMKKFKITTYMLSRGKKEGLFVSVSHKEASKRSKSLSRFNSPSLETRAKISAARKKYLLTHPHPWANTKHNYSAPCELLKSLLKEEKINFIEEFQPLREKGRFFAIDIYFPELKLGIEINGTNHYDKQGNLAPYYLDRHNLICAEGISLVEIRYHKIYSEDFRRELIRLLREPVVENFSPLSEIGLLEISTAS